MVFNPIFMVGEETSPKKLNNLARVTQLLTTETDLPLLLAFCQPWACIKKDATIYLPPGMLALRTGM